MKPIDTERLTFREWKEKDSISFYHMSQDPKVMEYFPSLWSMELVTIFIANMEIQLKKKKYTLWVVEEKNSKEFMGFIGLNSPQWEAQFTPCVEIGWRLAYPFWGKGYATEGAKAVLDYAFEELKLVEVVAFTVPDNLRSRRVMDKIGMIRDEKGDFLHPKLDPKDRFAKHVLYRIQNPLLD